MTDFIAVIPARTQSSRLPDKPLADIAGIPMVIRTAQQAQKSLAKRVIIATDDTRVYDLGKQYGIEVCMTDPKHPTGTDRLSEVALSLRLSPNTIIVNVQGDEPCIAPELINEVAHALAHSNADIATMAHAITESSKLFNPNVVKVVCTNQGQALYFSRAPIPWARDFMIQQGSHQVMAPGLTALHHIGLYAYRVHFLEQFPRLQIGPLEQWESLEQLRALENGFKIQVSKTDTPPEPGVDTPEDLARVRERFANQAFD